MSAHRDEQVAEINDLGLTRGIFEDARRLGPHCRHQRIFGRADRHHWKDHPPAGQTTILATRRDIAGRCFERCAKGFQRLQVQIDRAVAYRTATRQRHFGFARTRQQRAKHKDGGPHFADNVIGRDCRSDLASPRRHHPAKILGPGTFNHG